MRRLAALAVATAALSAAAPAAQAQPICQGGSRVGVCVTVLECEGICQVRLVVNPYCNQGHPAIGACSTIDNLYVEPGPR
ncbi:MAG TPA: hypothetical protein VNA20_05660 [Frankiaceae bacterium]|nr:hypothetical protein [Frankiaceae bacterium]